MKSSVFWDITPHSQAETTEVCSNWLPELSPSLLSNPGFLPAAYCAWRLLLVGFFLGLLSDPEGGSTLL